MHSIHGRNPFVAAGRRATQAAVMINARLIQRAVHSEATATEDVGSDHGRVAVLMPQQRLDGTDVITGFQPVWHRNAGRCAGRRDR